MSRTRKDVKQAQEEAEMDMTPMIDVVFLLIIFFVLVIDLSQRELEDLILPKATYAVLDEEPSFYFRRQCWISGDPDETTLSAVIPRVGEDRFFWASDFPHPDHPPSYIPEVERIVRELPESARAGFLGRNVLDAYGLK